MKNLIKNLLLFLALLNIQPVQSQTIEPVTVSTNGVVTLKGKGKLGGNKDGAQWRRYKFARTGNFYISGYFRSLTNSSSSFTGLAFRNIPANKAIDGGNATIGLFVENDTLKAKLKLNDNTRFVDVAVLPNVKLPVRLKIEKNNNSIKFYYSKDPENTLSPVYTLVTTVANAFTGWNDITQNFATGSKLSSSQTAVVSNISFGAVTADGTPACTNGGTFDVVSVTKTTGTLYNVYFNAANLSSVNINISSAGSASVRNYTTNVTANPLSIDVGSQAEGGYTLTLTGQSCVGVASKNFTIGSPTVSTPPTISSSPASVIAGSPVTFTATGCAGTVNWFKISGSTTYGTLGSNTNLSVSSPTATDSYFASCTVGTVVSAASNYIEVQSAIVTGGGGNQVVSFQNITKTVATETVLGKYNPDAFPTISVINSTDAKLGRTYPNWAIGWKVEGGNFSRSVTNKKTQNVGIPFMYDINSNAYSGYGVKGVDFVFTENPNNGCPFGQTRTPYDYSPCSGTVTDIDPDLTGAGYNAAFGNLAHSYQNFASAIPFELKAGGGFGLAGDGEIARWDNATLQSGLHYDDGQKGGTPTLGMRDWVSGKANVGLSDADIELGIEVGQDGSNKHLAFLIGFGRKVRGYAFSQYSAALGTVYIDPSKYPLNSQSASSGYPVNTQLINGVDGEPNSGNTGIRANDIPTSNDWNPNNKISIPNRFSGQLGILDVPNVLPCIEIASYASATFDDGADFYYDQNNASLKRTINKFGLNANADHVVARVIFAGETNKWFVDNKLDGRKVILQSKITCDAGTFGTLNYSNGGPNKYFDKESLRFAHFGRKYGFMIGGFTAFTGCEWNIWDRNDAGHNLDGYHGAFGLINLMYQRKTFGNTAVSFVDLKTRAKFLLWDSEISYDNGVTWVKDKANNYVMDKTKIPQRQFLTSDGYWGGFLARPENTEGTSCKLRVTYNGTVYYYTVTANDWETVDYDSRNIALSSLPNSKKHYHYFLIKLGSVVIDNTSPVAPSITSNINSPTAGQTFILTSSGCAAGQTNKWYTADEGNYLSSGLTFTTTATNGNSYFAKCTTSSQSSAASNTFTVTITPPSSGGVTITEPAKSQYYFSDGHDPSYYASGTNLPAIIQHTSPAHYDEANECVIISNANVKYVINLRRGGHINGAYRIGSTFNYVYNGYDGGFQVGVDLHQKPDIAYTQGGKSSADCQDDAGYNVTHGGTYTNGNGFSYTPTLIDYHTVGTNGYYVKFRPLFYTMNPGEFAKNYIEVTYTLIGDVLKAEYVYTSFRDDNQINTSFGFVGQSVPACFLNNQLTRFKSYTGSSAWTNGGLTDVLIPTSGVCATPGTSNSPEHWGFAYNPSTNIGFGVMNLTQLNNDAGFVYKQCEVNSGNPPGTEFGGGFTYISPTLSMQNFTSGTFTFNTTAYIMVGTDTQVRGQFKTISGN